MSRVASFILPASADRSPMLEKVVQFCGKLGSDKRWRVTVEPYSKTRSSSQNAYLWGVVYPIILQTLEGWEAEDVHTYLLGEHYGWDKIEGLGRPRMRPVRRSSKMTTVEFSEHVEFIQRFMAERGVYVPDPNE